MNRITTVFIITALLFATAGPLYAQRLPIRQNQSELNRNAGAREIRNSSQASGTITQRQAVNLAKQQFSGNVLRISLIGEGENQRYQIRMESEGKVFTVFVHIATGRVTRGGL
ncbi:MAG: hypothetical protein COA96_17545 [SAR86 cluster bacterium]|uniref:PepSY domain-containing protein n=1 Tax=SAR86 cluster bacterium TaxID=2030880 RepID=A0A2A5AEB8_9GAMM|nr:MAG: hypothetical protein COA96_17545 [SAR86 cluster bacterium]